MTDASNTIVNTSGIGWADSAPVEGTASVARYLSALFQEAVATTSQWAQWRSALEGAFHVASNETGTGIAGRVEAVLKWLPSEEEVDIPEPSLVRNYLLAFPDIIDLLPVVSRIARDHVVPSSALSLEVFRDQDADDEYLVIYIRQDSYSEQFLSQIDTICDEYQELLVNRSGWLLVTTDFRPRS